MNPTQIRQMWIEAMVSIPKAINWDKPVETTAGRPVRVVDRNYRHDADASSVLCVIADNNAEFGAPTETAFAYRSDGNVRSMSSAVSVPQLRNVAEKHTVYVNVSRKPDGGLALSSHETADAALSSKRATDTYARTHLTAPIGWLSIAVPVEITEGYGL